MLPQVYFTVFRMLTMIPRKQATRTNFVHIFWNRPKSMSTSQGKTNRRPRGMRWGVLEFSTARLHPTSMCFFTPRATEKSFSPFPLSEYPNFSPVYQHIQFMAIFYFRNLFCDHFQQGWILEMAQLGLWMWKVYPAIEFLLLKQDLTM